MPRDMFGDVVDSSIKIGSQKWYTIPLSIFVHTAVIAAVVIIPLLAADVLVSPRLKGLNTPMKIYSYLDSGSAVLATRLRTHTQVLDDGTGPNLLEPAHRGGPA